MIYSIGTQFSREFTHEESSITLRLTEELNINFENKNYGERIKKIYIGVVCVSKGFEPFFPIRPLKILKNEAALEYELKLDFESFKPADEKKRNRLLASEILKITKEVLAEKTINGFEKESFINDLENYFKSQDYLIETII